MTEQSKAKAWTPAILVSIVMAVATCFIAYAYYSQIGIMKGTLEVLKETSRVQYMPRIKLHLHSEVTKGSHVEYEETDEGGERWNLPYYVINTGEFPAYSLQYYHTLTQDSTIDDLSEIQFEHQWEDNSVWPGDVYICGFDQILRQQAIDAFKVGSSYYRHFVVRFLDEFQNSYTYQATWEFSEYTEGEPIQFYLRSYRRIDVDQ